MLMRFSSIFAGRSSERICISLRCGIKRLQPEEVRALADTAADEDEDFAIEISLVSSSNIFSTVLLGASYCLWSSAWRWAWVKVIDAEGGMKKE
jgi:hypothetical protein